MPAIIRHWMSARPVMLAGIVTAAVTRPPMLVTKPWAPARRTWFSITSWIARSTSPFCSSSCFSAAAAAARQRADAVDRAVQRLADEAVVSPGASSRDVRRQRLADDVCARCAIPSPTLIRTPGRGDERRLRGR